MELNSTDCYLPLQAITSLLINFFDYFQNIQIVEDSDQFFRWETLPQSIEFKVYFFNVTNVAEVQAGGKPRVKEIGPYIYSQYRRKYNIQFSDTRETVTFTQQQKYFFNARASAPLTENDSIVVLNLVMNVSSLLLLLLKSAKKEKDFRCTFSYSTIVLYT